MKPQKLILLQKVTQKYISTWIIQELGWIIGPNVLRVQDISVLIQVQRKWGQNVVVKVFGWSRSLCLCLWSHSQTEQKRSYLISQMKPNWHNRAADRWRRDPPGRLKPSREDHQLQWVLTAFICSGRGSMRSNVSKSSESGLWILDVVGVAATFK